MVAPPRGGGLELLDARRERVDRRFAVQRADLQLIAPRLPRLQERELAALPGVESAGVAVRGRLHRDPVCALTEHPPHRVEAESVLAVDLIRTQPRPPVHDGDWYTAVRIRDRIVLVALLREGGARTSDALVVAGRILRDRHAFGGRDQVVRPRVDDRPPNV